MGKGAWGHGEDERTLFLDQASVTESWLPIGKHGRGGGRWKAWALESSTQKCRHPGNPSAGVGERTGRKV